MKERISMLDEKLVELLNDQVNKEFYSAYLYLSMANYYNEEGLSGFGNWFTIQAQEERDHAMLFLEYLQNNGAHVELKTVEAPKKKFKEFKDPLDESLKHERYVTASIHNIYAAASKVKDFRTMQFLDWFVKEQGEEEKTAEDLIKKLELFGQDGKGLYMVDSELAARTYSAPTLTL